MYNLVVWLNFAWSFGLISLGRLAFFRLVIWQSFVRLFVTILFGCLWKTYSVVCHLTYIYPAFTYLKTSVSCSSGRSVTILT